MAQASERFLSPLTARHFHSHYHRQMLRHNYRHYQIHFVYLQRRSLGVASSYLTVVSTVEHLFLTVVKLSTKIANTLSEEVAQNEGSEPECVVVEIRA